MAKAPEVPHTSRAEGPELGVSAKRAHWNAYRARRVDAPSTSGLPRASVAVAFWANAVKEHSAAVVGWGQEVIEQRRYPIKRLVPDMLTFGAGAMHTATEWWRLVAAGNRKDGG